MLYSKALRSNQSKAGSRDLKLTYLALERYTHLWYHKFEFASCPIVGSALHRQAEIIQMPYVKLGMCTTTVVWPTEEFKKSRSQSQVKNRLIEVEIRTQLTQPQLSS